MSGKGRGQSHPQGDRRDGAEDLDDPLDHRMGEPAIKARAPAQDNAEDEAHGHADQSDGERDARAIHQPRPHVPSLHVRAEYEDGMGGLAAAVDPDQMARGRDQPEEPILEALREEPHRDLLIGIRVVDAPEGLEISRALDGVHVRAKPPALEPVDGLGRHQGALRLGDIRIGVGEEVRDQYHHVEPDDDQRAQHGHAVLPESPPGELPLRGHEDALVARGRHRPGLREGSGGWIERDVRSGHQLSSRRMRGSIHTRTMSETSVPMTVITPSMSTIVPARNMSCEMSALSRSGPTVGSPSTSDTMMLPETMYGSVYPIVLANGLRATRTGYFTMTLPSVKPLERAVTTYGLRSSSSRLARMIRICCAVPARPRMSAGIGRCLARSQALARLQGAS